VALFGDLSNRRLVKKPGSASFRHRHCQVAIDWYTSFRHRHSPSGHRLIYLPSLFWSFT
jgi:hypothetical protein